MTHLLHSTRPAAGGPVVARAGGTASCLGLPKAAGMPASPVAGIGYGLHSRASNPSWFVRLAP